jgi:hypothetical protein
MQQANDDQPLPNTIAWVARLRKFCYEVVVQEVKEFYLCSQA